MSPAEQLAFAEMHVWQQRMQRPPSFLNGLARRVQLRLNALLPERVHRAITSAIKQMVRGALFGSTHITRRPLADVLLPERETAVRTRIRYYRNTASAEGAITGAGGFLLGLADFPLLMGLKLKLLFDIAALYGHDVRDYTERLYSAPHLPIGLQQPAHPQRHLPPPRRLGHLPPHPAHRRQRI